MSAAMDRIRARFIDEHGDAPTTPVEALAHVLAVWVDEPDDRLMIEATNGIYGDSIRTGLTMGDLRAVAAQVAEADAQYSEADYWRESYRLAKGLTNDEIGAIIAVRDASKSHPRPCQFPHEACLCND